MVCFRELILRPARGFGLTGLAHALHPLMMRQRRDRGLPEWARYFVHSGRVRCSAIHYALRNLPGRRVLVGRLPRTDLPARAT